MDGVIQAIHSAHKDQGDKKELDLLVVKLQKASKTIQKNIGNIDNILNGGVINSASHTLGYLWLLHAKATLMEIKNHTLFIENCRELLLHGDALSLRMVPLQVAELCEKFTLSLLVTETSMHGVLPLRVALQKLTAERPALLTPIHRHFLLCCIKSHCYRAALPILNQACLEVDAGLNGLTAQQYLESNYYGGIVCIALGRYSQALDLLQLVLTAPSQVLSKIQAEAYKKYSILCLIVHGELVPLPPSSTSQVVLKHIERTAQPYVELAKAYKKDAAQIQKVIGDNDDVFKKDNNTGLIKRALKAMTRKNIQRLTNTYVTLSLRDIATAAKLETQEEAEMHVVKMIDEQAIFAKINQKDGMLSFLDNPEDYDTMEMVHELDHKIREVMQLSEKVKEINHSILLDPNYVKVTMPSMNKGDKAQGGGLEDIALAKALEASMQ